jgi:hypothetical protein
MGAWFDQYPRNTKKINEQKHFFMKLVLIVGNDCSQHCESHIEDHCVADDGQAPLWA